MCTTQPPLPFIRIVEYLLNTIDSFRNRRHLSVENAVLRQQLSQYKDVSEENAVLRKELSRPCSQSERKATTPEQTVTDNQKPQYNPISPDMVSQTHQPPTENTTPKQVVPQNAQETGEDAALRAEIAHYREQHAELLERYEKLIEVMKRKKIDSFEDLAEHDKESMKILIELARLTPPLQLEGNNIGLFGSTSTGKSTMLNTLLGQNVAPTGVGETTTEIKAYQGSTFTLWDVPGRNDEVSYLSMQYISFFKGLTRRLILIQATVKENSSMMKLLDELGLHYNIVFNKFDKVDEEEQAAVRQQIQSEVQLIGLKQVENVFFVSSKYPKMFSDWMTMVDHLNNHTI